MTARRNVEDFLDAIRQEPALRAEVRRDLLTQELMETPETVAKLVNSVESLGKHAEATNRRLDRIESDISEMKDDVKDVKGNLTEAQGDVKSNHALLVSIGTAVGSLSGVAVESVLQGRVMQTLESRLNMVEPVVLVSINYPTGRTTTSDVW